MKSWFESLFSDDRREAERFSLPPLMAYYWDGAAPAPHPIRNIDVAGMYLITDRRWYPNTLITMTLQRTDVDKSDPDRAIVVNASVVRSGSDGVGFRFFLPKVNNVPATHGLPASKADKKTLARFLTRIQEDAGCDADQWA
jgi:hypothetical protein